jgi:hypothetical protein
MTVEVILTLAGILLIFVGIAGKKITLEAKDIKVIGNESLTVWQRVALAIIGILFIVISIQPTQTWILQSLSQNTPTPSPTLYPTLSETHPPPSNTLMPTETNLEVWQDTEKSTGCTVNLNGYYVNKVDTSPLKWFWGDGTNTEGRFPQEHVYEQDGIYTIVVEAPSGKTNIINIEITDCEYAMILTEETQFTLSVTLKDGRYVFGATADRPLPTPAELKGGGKIDFIWFVDADEKTETGQSQRGNDYNIHLYLNENGWGTKIYSVSEVALEDIVNERSSEVSYYIENNYAEISFPASFLPEKAFIYWLNVSSVNSTDEWKKIMPYAFNSPKQEFIP